MLEPIRDYPEGAIVPSLMREGTYNAFLPDGTAVFGPDGHIGYFDTVAEAYEALVREHQREL